MPLPYADRRLPRMRVRGRALLVIWCSFVRVFPGRSRCAGRPAAVPTGPGIGPATLRSRRAAGGGGCRSAAALPGEPRRALPPAAPAGAAIPPGGQSAPVPPARRPWPGRGTALSAWPAGFRPPAPVERLPWALMYRDGYVTVKLHMRVRVRGRLVTDLERSYPSAAACLAEDLPALCVHLEYPLRLRRRLRSGRTTATDDRGAALRRLERHAEIL